MRDPVIQSIDKQIEHLRREIKSLQSLRSNRLEDLRENKRKSKNEIERWQRGLKQATIDCQMTYREIGDKIGVSYQTVGKWCNMDKPVPPERIKQLIKVLDYKIKIL